MNDNITEGHLIIPFKFPTTSNTNIVAALISEIKVVTGKCYVENTQNYITTINVQNVKIIIR